MKKRIFKKNQIIVTALAILIAVAGYINYADSALKKEDSAGSASAGEEASAAGSEENSFLRLKIELGSAPNGFLASKMNFRSKKTVFRG